jgi:hypothetical protein
LDANRFDARPLLRAVVVAGLASCLPAHAETEVQKLNATVERLLQRMEQLEEANKRLQSEVEQLSAEKAAAADAPKQADAAEPDAAKPGAPAGEAQAAANAGREPSKLEQALEGVSVGASVAMVSQRALRGTTDGNKSQLNYRADVEVEIPLAKVADVGESKLFFHIRAGQGEGLVFAYPTLTATPNSTAFFKQDSDDSSTVIGQAWYQFTHPLAAGESGAQPSIEATIGKIDLFGFFDQNTIADSETDAFLNNVFVHNPLLDSGGAIGGDSYGFQPGVIASYASDASDKNHWKASLGVFASGSGASFNSSFNRPFVIGQLGYSGQVLQERPGNYRVYAWTNGSFTPYNNALASPTGRTSGIGLSVDQEVADGLTLFTRYGHAFDGEVRFNNAVTLGAQLTGARWGRENDRVGVAFGWLNTSSGFRSAAATLDVDGDGVPDIGYSPTGAEKDFELYYAWQINPNLQISPSLQWIGQPGGDPNAKDIWAIGLRAVAGF